MVGVDRRAPLGAEHQVQLDRVGWPAGFDFSKRDRLGLPAGETQAGLLAAVLAQCLDREGWQGQDGVAGSGLDREGCANSYEPRELPVCPGLGSVA